ncbi:MAG TPA: nucleoside monophosphate kinase [Bryobacteraceae bacterium]|nr:nucleoside monophosphate kinase [Bryobacteraceae bacterium]
MFRRTLLLALAPFLALAQSKPIIILLGPPGSGKSTQAAALKRRLRVPVVSVSEVLKKEIGAKTTEGKTLRAAIESGQLMRADVMNDMMERRLYESDTNGGFILDGYPRTQSQAGFLDRTLLARGFPTPKVIVLEITDDEVTKRSQSRNRADDKAGLTPGRLAEYRQEEKFLKGHYQAQLVTIDGSADEKAVEAAIQKALGY